MLHKQRIRSRQPEEKFEKAVKYTLKNKYREKWNILKIPWKVYEIRKQLDVSFIILMLIRGLSWKNWEERVIKGSRGAIVFYNNNQPSHLLEMDYKIWPNIQQRREAKGRIVVIEVPTHPPPPSKSTQVGNKIWGNQSSRVNLFQFEWFCFEASLNC